MGTGVKLAPTYACLGLGKFEKMVFDSDEELLQKIVIWKRFIDDVFMLFRGSKSECEDLVNWLNGILPGVVKFKYEYSHQKIEFLDLEISIENGCIKTNLFIKPTNKQLYLDFNSNHPLPCRESIPYSQALRVVERCSTPEDRDAQLADLRAKFEERNYPSKLIEEKFEKAKQKDRKTLIFQSRKKKMKDNKVRLMFTHSDNNPPIQMWMRQCKQLLAKNEKAKKIGQQIQIASKQAKNLQNLIGGFKGQSGAPPEPPLDSGCYKCNKCRVSCPILNESKTFKSRNTGKIYKIRQKLTCTSDWLIYLATCQRCQGQYVGKSKTPFKIRHSNHKQEIKKKVGGLGHHYGEGGGCEYKHLSIQLIEQVKVKTLPYLAERECYWQHQLRVYAQNGGRAHCLRKDI